MRTAAWEAAPALRDCSKEAVGERSIYMILVRGSSIPLSTHCNHFNQRFSASQEDLMSP